MESYYISGNRIPKADLEQAVAKGDIFSLEEKYNVRIVISDNKYIYMSSPETLKSRMEIQDRYTNIPFQPNAYTFLETRIHENVTSSGYFYTFGNLYGNRSIILGERFKNIVDSADFQNLVGKGLKNVTLFLKNGQFELNSYELRD